MANALQAFVDKAKKTADAARGRLVFALDATASRGPTWELAKSLQGEMFSAGTQGLEVSLIYFNGSGVHASEWTTDPARIRELMDQVTPVTGLTKIANVIHYAVTEHATRKVDALVFIGDAQEEDEDYLAHLAGVAAPLGIRGFFFQDGENGHVTEDFKRLAKIMNGAFAAFDSSAPGLLKDLLAAIGAFASGGLKALGSKDSDAARLLLAQLK